MNRIIILAAAFCAVHIGVKAQSLETVLGCVERNNRELQVLKKGHEASMWEVKADNNLEDLSVEYSPFYRKGVSGVASSELVVTQGFDFPTLYAARRKSGDLQQTVLDWQYLVSRRDILLQAKNAYLDLVLIGKTGELLAMRSRNADELLRLYEKRLVEGEATIIEVNKIKMEKMSVAAEVARNESARTAAKQSLVALNGNEPLSFDNCHYPELLQEKDYEAIRERSLSVDPAFRMAQAETDVSGQEVKVNKQLGIPKLEIGYRRNTEIKEASNGFLVGASIPLFSNRHKVKAAKAQFITAQMQQDNVRMQVESRMYSLYEELKTLKQAVGAYDVVLMYSTLDVLRKAVEGGEMSLTEYYTEADGVYQSLQEYMELENQYRKLEAEFCKNEL